MTYNVWWDVKHCSTQLNHEPRRTTDSAPCSQVEKITENFSFIARIDKYTATNWLYTMCSVHRTRAMVSTTICMKIVVLMLISDEVMFVRIFGAKILFLPVNINSHVLYFSRLAADLAQLGHVTRVLAPSNARTPQFIRELQSVGNFSYTTYLVDGEEPFMSSRNASAIIMRLALSRSFWERFTLVGSLLKDAFNHCESDCARLLDNDYIMRQVRDEGYQFAVMDPIAPQCYYAIPYSLGISYATLWGPVFAWTYRVPRFASFTPSLPLGLGYTDRMSFVQRLTTFVFDLLCQFQLQNNTTAYVDRLAPDRPSVDAHQLLQRVQISHISFHFFRHKLFEF